MCTFLAEQLNTFNIKRPLTVELSFLTITRQVSICCVSSHSKGERRTILNTSDIIRPLLLIIHQRQLSLMVNTDCHRSGHYSILYGPYLKDNNSLRSPNFLDNGAIYEGWNFNSGNYLFTTDTK